MYFVKLSLSLLFLLSAFLSSLPLLLKNILDLGYLLWLLVAQSQVFLVAKQNVSS